MMDRFRCFPTPDISDLLNRLYAVDPQIRCLTDPRHQVCGPAMTVKVYPGDNLMVHKALDVAERGDVVIVDVSGKVTLGDGGDVVLKDKMQSLVQQGRKKVLLNLAEVSYVDSAGLGEIVQSYATVMKNGGALKLLNVTKRIKDLLSITKLLTVFECFDSEAEAVTSFSSM
jgi:anti-sigma B factor antagonist